MASDGLGRFAADAKAVVYHFEPGTPILGLWCETCLLPTLITVPIVLLTPDGVRDWGFAEVCERCKHERWIRP